MSTAKDRLITLIRAEDIRRYSYKELAEKIGLKHASQSRHYLMSLIDNKVVMKSGSGRYTIIKGEQANSLLSFPLMGEVNCGEATIYADDVVQDVVRVSPSQINVRHPERVFALKAVGESMNLASIQGKSIETGDYIFVEPSNWWDIADGDYVVSIIDGMANAKRLHIDVPNQRIVLNSESREHFEPIIIGLSDLHLYSLSGRIVDVVRGVRKQSHIMLQSKQQ